MPRPTWPPRSTSSRKPQIRAPIAGTVYSVDAARTEYAEQGKLLLQMADLRHERVRAYFDEPDIGHLAVGQKIVIKWDAKPGQEWHGHISSALPSTVITYGTRNVGEVLVEIDGSTDGLAARHQCQRHGNHLQRARRPQHSARGASPPERQILRLQSCRTTSWCAPQSPRIANLTQVAILTGLEEGDWVATGTISGQPLQEGVPVKVVR